jgi:hypothetical protein
LTIIQLMNEDQVIPAREPETENPQKGDGSSKKVIGIIGGIILIIGIALFSYVMGTKSTKTEVPEEVSPTPQRLVEPTDTPTPTIEEKLSPTATKTLTPTKKPTSTPTVTPTPTPVIKTKILNSTASLDGFRSSNNGGNDSLEIRAGRNENLTTRGFLSFSLSDIPAGSVITEATLRLYQKKIDGSPYSVGGNLKIDHLNYGDSLDSTDYGMAAFLSNFATLTSNATVEWKDALVTSEVKDDFAAARSRSQFRIHFETEVVGGTATGDFTYFESADNNMGSGNTPQLVVKYY